MLKFARALQSVGILILLFATWIISIYHLSVFRAPMPEHLLVRQERLNQSYFLSRQTAGVNQLVLFGDPYERGLAAGRLTSGLMHREEDALVAEMNKFFPNPVTRWALMVGAMRWFYGIDPYLYPWATEEMYGVAASATPDYNFLADPFTRQVAYHGVHEVGQMFVDFEKQDFGCTFVGVPFRGSWLVGRNFDFEAVRLLDTEKIAKWIFPDTGHAYLAVTWAGMVGTVTGVNDHGVYVSINAAGTTDFSRYGTPTTLVALKVLQEADTAKAAVKIIEDAQVFITDLFTVVDPAGGGFYVVEKTPQRFHTTFYAHADAVTNHLTSAEFQSDRINQFRMQEQTTVARQNRARELVATWHPAIGATSATGAQAMAEILRDKRGVGGKLLHYGNRSALDALIATHSIIYDGADQEFWISQGPALSGGYSGFDLRRSFQERRPVFTESLPEDMSVPPNLFVKYQTAMKALKIARTALKAGKCEVAGSNLEAIAASPASDHYEYLMTQGDFYQACQQNMSLAKVFWRRSLAGIPAYHKHERYLQEALR